MSVAKAILTIFTAIIQLLVPTVAKLTKGEASFFTQWSAEQAYSEENVITMEKTEGKDFVVLNLADVQVSDGDIYISNGKIAEKTIRQLVTDLKPDLITLSGDNAWGVVSYIWVIQLMESLNTPWAPVMGNHDGQGCPDEFWCAYELCNAKNCLFQFGPKDMGYGNYIINVTENGNIIHTLFMLDSHNNGTFTNEAGEKVSGYDNVWANQMDWYKWAVNGIAAKTGSVVESSVIMHIPLVQYKTAWDLALAGDGSVTAGTGSRGEGECSSPVDNGFFDLMKEMGSTKTVLVGHDHVNDYSVVYEGINLAYGVKTGPACYYESGKNGGTTININSDGVASIENHYIDELSFGYTPIDT